MLARKRGGLSGRNRRMAKKNAPTALQTEVTTDDEWAKILERKGLILADIYSEWSGPCTGMVSILKKVKMEMGGDNLSYAVAKCDNIAALERFRGKSEPTWMFIHNGRMVNLVFGANCPELLRLITLELSRIENGEPHDFSIPVSQSSPEEEKRLQALEEGRLAKEAAKAAAREAEIKARYEAEMLHLTTSLSQETCLLLYPWIFKDEEGHRRDKKSSPPYVELVDEVIADAYNVAQEMKKQLNPDIIKKILIESDYAMTDEAQKLLCDGKCLFVRLRVKEKRSEIDADNFLLNLLYGEPRLPKLSEPLVEGCYADRHRPTFSCIPCPFVWAPPNPRNKATVFRVIFGKYVESTYPYEDKTSNVPITVFKYDSTRRNELKVVLEMFTNEVANFGIFERDKPPEAKLIATSIEQFESNAEEKTSYEVFVCVVKKVGSEAFLSFAGIGPYHVSESPEKAVEESKLYFPRISQATDEVQSDDEDKPEDGQEEKSEAVPDK